MTATAREKTPEDRRVSAAGWALLLLACAGVVALSCAAPRPTAPETCHDHPFLRSIREAGL